MSEHFISGQISGSTKIMGLVGQGLSHTLSPKIHNRAAKRLGINAVYVPFDIPATAIEPLMSFLWEADGIGFNITTPHKTAVARVLGESSPSSVNTVYRGPQGWQGASTDALGFERGLTRLGCELSSFRRVVILGSGGASLALVAHITALVNSRTERLIVLRRSNAHDSQLQAYADSRLSLRPLEPSALTAALGGADTLLIQATSAPLRGDDLSDYVPALNGYKGVVIDLVYGTPSALYHAARAQGLKAQDGLPMLIEQARIAQELWWGQAASYDELAAAALER